MTAMTEVAAADLAGKPLNWAVGMAEGLDVFVESGQHGNDPRVFVRRQYTVTGSVERYDPANDWATGGPLIEKYQMDLTFERVGLIYSYPCSDDGLPMIASEDCFGSYGSKHLIAACRAIVAAKLGETVSVPAELMP